MRDLTQAKQAIAKAPPSSGERLAVLLAKSAEFYRASPKQAEKWGREASKLAIKLKNTDAEARAEYIIGCSLYQQCEYAKALQSFERAMELDPDNRLKDPPVFSLGLAHSKLGNLDKAIDCYQKALKLCRANPSKLEVSILIAMGNTSLTAGDYPRALKYQYEALANLDLIDNPLSRSIVLANIAGVYLQVHDLEKADSFYERAATLKKELVDVSGLAAISYNRGLIAVDRNKFSSARYLFTEALRLAKTINKHDSEAYVNESLGKIEVETGNNLKALRNFKKSIEISQSLQLVSVWASSLIGLGKTQVVLGKIKEGIASLQEAVGMSEKSKMMEIECESCGALAKAYEAAGNLKQAVQYFNRFIALSGDLHSQQRQRALVEIQARVEIEKADRERARMEALAKDANQRADILKSETERQSKELTTLALQLVEKNEFLCNLKEDLGLETATRKTKALIERIDDHIRSDRDWETFEHQFNQIHREFLNTLSTSYPALTPTELKIAVLMKLNLTSKAIANLFCLSARTVENHRLSIRKKLGLHGDDNLVSFLTGFGGER